MLAVEWGSKFFVNFERLQRVIGPGRVTWPLAAPFRASRATHVVRREEH
jgi:hypothetical protein